jgi:hypothetical protein
LKRARAFALFAHYERKVSIGRAEVTRTPTLLVRRKRLNASV